jgi:hypothetical protein
MKNSQKGSVALIVIILIVIVLAGGYYFYSVKNNQTPQGDMTQNNATSSTQTNSNSNSNEIAVAGMSKYTDGDFGFSFWYPSSWQVKILDNTHGNIIHGKLAKILQIGPDITLEEVHSTDLSITDTSGKWGPSTYFFNPSTHTWMAHKDNDMIGARGTTTADVSNNTMGGLHIFPSSFGFHGQLFL